MRCEILPLSRFDAVKADWARLAAHHSHAPFLDPDFVGPLVEHFALGRERIVKVISGTEVVALGIFSRRGAMWETFQPSQIPIGCLVAAPRLAWTELLAHIGKALPLVALGVGASQQDPMCTPRPAEDGTLATLDYITTAWIDVVGTFDDYWNARGKNLRQNLRKQRRKLADEGITATLDVITEAADVKQAIADYGALESAGWKAGGGTAIGVDNTQGRFYTRMLEAFCAKGRGRIYRYRFNDRIVAIDLCIQSDDALVILKTTYDETIKSLSPSALMREEAFRQLWDAGPIRRIEFFGRVMEWHTRWTDQSRTMYHVNWYRWPSLMRAISGVVRRVKRPEATAGSAELQGGPG